MARLIWLLVFALIGSGCSIRKFAINKVGDAIASGGSVYESDEDVELVAGALPFGLKLTESLLAESPKHKGLLLAASRGFTSYAYIEVQPKIDEVSPTDLDAADRLRLRARRLYLRALDYGLRALDLSYPGFSARFQAVPMDAARALSKSDVPLIYWTAASLGMAISVSRDDVPLLARIPEVEALLDRALELDEGWNSGALHEFKVIMAGTRPASGTEERIRAHYARALQLSGGRSASLFVAYAEAACVPQQNRQEFESMLGRALEIDVDARKETRLLTLVAQRRARWLLGRADELFLSLTARK